MNCARCGDKIPPEEEMEHHGQILCEECYMRALSPARACDPWSVRSAQKLSQMNESYSTLSKTQENILRILEETGGIEPIDLAKRLQMKMIQLEVEIAKLRHMEKVRGELRSGKTEIKLWE